VGPWPTLQCAHAHGQISRTAPEPAAALQALARLAALDPLAPATHIALAGALAIGQGLIEEARRHWAERDDEPARRWRRDRELMGVAGSARERRLASAWKALDARARTVA
jgi:acyl-CoA dehydrogenase